MRRFPAGVEIALTLVAAWVLFSGLQAAAADTRWLPVGPQQGGEADKPVWSMAVSRVHPTVMLAATEGRGILRSSDSGATWTSVTPTVQSAWVVRFDPQQTATAYAGTQASGVLKSTDEGLTWTSVGTGVAQDVRSIDLFNGTIVVGTSQGVFDSQDGAATWHHLGLPDRDVSAVAMLPKSGGFTIFAGIDNGTRGNAYLMQSEDLSGTFTGIKGNLPADATVASLAVGAAPSGGTQPPVLAATSQGLFRSDDRGASFSPINGLPAGDINLALFNPANPDQIYAASDSDLGSGGVFRSVDRGASWSALGGGLPNRPRITALALQPTTPLQVLAATWNPTTGQAGTYRITDSTAAIGGASPGSSASASAAATSPVQTAAPQPVVPRLRSLPALSPSYAVAVAVLAAIGLFLLLRRWRMRREDRRTYAP